MPSDIRLRLTERNSVLPQRIREDLLTDWIPDAVGGLGVDWRHPLCPTSEAGQSITVAMRKGWRTVPHASLEFRSWANARVARSIAKMEPHLSPMVYGYRDATTSYRDEWKRLQDQRFELAKAYPVVIHLDVERFFESVQISKFENLLSREALSILQSAKEAYGLPLLPGHRWARRLANVLLSTVDDVAGTSSLRWQDDYWIYGRTVGETQGRVADMQRALDSIGLRGRTTSGTGPTKVHAKSYSNPRVLFDHAYDRSDVAQLKFALRLLYERSDNHAVARLPELASRHPVLVPRIAMYIERFLETLSGREALGLLLQDAPVWVTARLVASACTSSEGERAVPRAAVDQLSASPVPAIRALAARVQHLSGLAVVDASPRIDSILDKVTNSTLRAHPPLVETTL